MSKLRLKDNVWLSMSLRSRIQLAVAVFLMFAVLGPLMILTESKLRIVPWSFVAIQILCCGGLAASIIIAVKRVWLIVVSIIFWVTIITLNSGGFSIVVKGDSVRTILGQNTGVMDGDNLEQPPVLSQEQLNAIYTQRTKIGLMAIAFLAIGYSRFIFVIRNEIKERARLQTEIAITKNIQQSLIPSKPFSNSWCNIAGIAQPATEVGGDYFDIIPISDTKIVVFIADVAGHGVESGILSAMTKSALHSEIKHNSSPDILLQSLNATLHEVSSEKMFVTAGYILLDQSSMTAHVSTAGHPPILHKKYFVDKVIEYRMPNPALGMKKDMIFTQVSFPLSSKDRILLFTDGVLEANNSKGEQFGMTNLLQMFASIAKLPEENCSTMVSKLKSFAQDENFKDDVTLVEINIL